MSPPKGPKKSLLSRKAQIDKLIQATEKPVSKGYKPQDNKARKNVQVNPTRKPRGPYQPLNKVLQLSQQAGGLKINVRLPDPPAYCLSTIPSPPKAKPTAPLVATVASLNLECDQEKVPVWLTTSKPFPFLDLPPEIRNKVYEYFFEPHHFRLQFISRKAKALTYTLPNRPRCEDPKVPASAKQRRRQFDYPRRVRSKETDIPTFELMPGPCSLLLAHPRIGREAATMFYALQTFSFASCRVLNAFMDMLPTSSKEAITNVRLRHYTAGHPQYNYIEYPHHPTGEVRQYPTHRFKVAYDNLWEETLWRLSDEMCNIESLVINETINEIPMEVHEGAMWRVPLGLALSEMPSMRKVKIEFHSCHADDAVLEVEAYKLEQELLAEEYRDTNDAIEYSSCSSQLEKLLPPEKRQQVKCIRLVMPGYERPAF